MEILTKEIFGKEADFFEDGKKYIISFEKLDRERSAVKIVIEKHEGCYDAFL
jgi:hypothetical protein